MLHILVSRRNVRHNPIEGRFIMNASTKIYTLVISFSGVLHALYHGRISAADLDGAFFYFGCTRSHVMDTGVGGESGEMQYEYHEDPEGVDEAYRIVRDAFLASEAAGRVVCRELHETPNWDQLNELLAVNGLPVIDGRGSRVNVFIGSGAVYSSHYSYPGVIEAVEKQGLPYRVLR